MHFQDEEVEAVDLRRWEQVGLQLFPENHYGCGRAESSRDVEPQHGKTCHHIDLGVQQCFGVVYHELTTLRQVYFARAATARAK